MSNKMRIQLLTPEGIVISDRLVDQNTEFYQGPKEKHESGFRIELVLDNQSDVDKAIEYLQKLSGKLPIEIKGVQGRKPTNNKVQLNDNSREILFRESYDQAKDQDDFIKILRDKDFVFVTSEHLKTIIPESYSISSRKLESYEWLIRCIKLAKDPRADKFDPTILIGIKILSERSDKMVLYMNGEIWKEKLSLKVPENAIGFKKTNLIKYPHYMTYEEREKWGIEHRALLNNPEKKKSKFYLRWEKDIKLSDEQKLNENK